MNYTVTKTDKQGKTAVDLFSEDFSENRRIWITGQIDSETARETIVALEYLDRAGSGEITVMINSPGGSVSDGMAILDAMRRCRCDIVTVATGMAASMGAFLAACGGTPGKRFVTPHCEVMIHQPLGGIQGQATEIELAAQHILKIKRTLNTELARATGKSVEEIARDTDRDNFMDADEAVVYGLADGILAP
ncbi:MAG: ATP-dependent Clp protease proteolytic subunit [Ruminococcaceae bacterium]|jgi:ATP-dependent Clp protease protease subunit|nr:ATP-dependent Clp protease proteolytic subunit [Oscillospiraceae bacterium]